MCNKLHGIWVCEEFKQLDVPKRWECAKKFKLCFRCLGKDHLGQYCTRTRVCGLGGCKEVHHRLLHKDHTSLSGGENKLFPKPKQNVSSGNLQEPAAAKNKQDKSEQRVDSPREGDNEQALKLQDLWVVLH